MVEILRVFAFDDVVVEKTSAFYIHWNQYYILTYLRFNFLHTLELLISNSDVLEVELDFFGCQRIMCTHKGIDICMRFCCLLNLY